MDLTEDKPIPQEAPRAPTQEEWDAMTPREREAAVDALICSVTQEELDEADAMAEGDEHYDAKEEIRGTLRTFFESLGRQVYVGAERKVIYPGQKGFTPDIMVVMDVSPHKRDCWMVSAEGRGVDVVIEVFYRGDWKKDFVDNVRRYAERRIPEYFIFDVLGRHITGYALLEEGDAYAPIRRNRRGKYPSAKLGLELGIRGGRLRFFQGSALVPTPAEVAQELEEVALQEQARAEQEQARAEQEQARAEQEQARATQSLAQLREALLNLLAFKGIGLTEQQEYEVRCCGDPLLLGRWFDRALRAKEAQEIFQDD